MSGRVWNLVWKEALQFWRYRLLLAFVLAFPAWNLVSVAGSISRGIVDIPTAVYDQDHSSASRRLVAMLDNSGYFDLAYFVSSQAELELLLERGVAKVGLLIPQDFEARLSAGSRQVSLQILLDGSETSTAPLAQAYLEGAAYAYVRQTPGQESTGVRVAIEELGQVDARARVWFNQELRREIFQLPAEMAGVVALLAILLPALTIVREREMGTLEQLFVTPIRPIELIVGKSLLTLVITYLGFLEMLALNIFHFEVPMRGSLALLLVLTGFYILIEMGWGLLISVMARTQGQGLLGAFFLVILEVILSGQILPVEYMPRAVQLVSHLMPNRHFNTIVRNIMLKGATLADLWPQVVILGILGVALYTLAAVRLRKRLE